jgi:GNAT superfamily N-acetyltransferase
MIDLVAKMTPPLANTTLVQEQLGFALNRAGDSERAEQVLQACITEHGATSENCGLLGRVYKDRWGAALKAGNDFEAQGQLELAVATYLQGFEADWRDAYPGINALTLMELSEPPDPRREALLPVVAYAVDRRIAAGKPDYWDHATRLELALLALDEKAARSGLGKALAAVREAFEPETTANNLKLIREGRERRAAETGTAVPKWCALVEAELMKVHERLTNAAKG